MTESKVTESQVAQSLTTESSVTEFKMTESQVMQSNKNFVDIYKQYNDLSTRLESML